MLRKRLKNIFIRFTILLTLSIMLFAGIATAAYFEFEKELEEKLAQKKFLTPTEYYAQPFRLFTGQIYTADELNIIFQENNFRRRDATERLLIGDYFIGTTTECQQYFSLTQFQGQFCIAWINKSTNANSEINTQVQLALANEANELVQLYYGKNVVSSLHLDAPLVAQYLGKEAIKQKATRLSETPLKCIQAILAIEDVHFLEHKGVSIKGIARALIKNITVGKKAQGGSTITQQLVKNYFLTSERTFKRKAQEIVMAIWLESKLSKDEILETYMNIIYMGQNGAFQVRGYGAASEYYFNKNLNDLNTSECALLAAVVNGPGIYHPFLKPDNAIKRRNLVLNKMFEYSFIDQKELTIATAQSLPKNATQLATETAPYYFDAVRKQALSLNISTEGAKIYTGLNLQLQQVAQSAIQKQLSELELRFPLIKKNKLNKKNLEGVVLSVDSRTGLIDVVVGGRSYKFTQFNRAIEGHRQIGSVMKPIVYLSALKTGEFNAETILNDEPVVYKYDKQLWSPENYDKKFLGKITLSDALVKSQNAATAYLGMKIGLNKVKETATHLGLESNILEVPSMTLGAFEMYPTEVLTAYSTLSQIGQYQKLSFIDKIVNNNNEILYEHKMVLQNKENPDAILALIDIMKRVNTEGTAKAIALSGFTKPSAGKTGTTNDFKDAWYVGFTAIRTSLIWVGYDMNEAHKLTGGTAAVPVWIELMKTATAHDAPLDFLKK